jgi:hypothetical protein
MVDYGSITSIISGFDKILKLTTVGTAQQIPTPLILVGAPRRPGLSATKISSRIISRKSEAGLPVGVLPSGAVNPDEVMWRIAIEELIKAIHEDAVVNVAIPPGTTLSAAGIGPSGPVSVFGSTIMYASGYGVIQ